METENFQEIVNESVSNLSEGNRADDRLARSDQFHLTKHNKEFTELLTCYVDNYKKLWKDKIVLRRRMFYACLILLFLVSAVSGGVIVVATVYAFCGNGSFESIAPAVVGAVASLISGFMTIPKIMAQYLYNAEEEKYLADIIGKIQEYDSVIRSK